MFNLKCILQCFVLEMALRTTLEVKMEAMTTTVITFAVLFYSM